MYEEPTQAVTVEVSRKVRIADDRGKTVFELENRAGDVSIRKVTTSTKRATVKLESLQEAVEQLKLNG